jgi:environmental stress-induced protein Ves
VQLLRARDRLIMPWKNGGGSTTEIAIGPAGASLDAFDWRVSMALVASDGPFSLFPGIDRTLAVIEGDGMELKVADRPAVTLGRRSAPWRFPGDVATEAFLREDVITDLNVMTRRGRFRHSLLRVVQPMNHLFDCDDIAIVLAIGGSAQVILPNDRATLDHADAVLIEARETAAFQINPAGDCYLILLQVAAV